jgi:VirB8 protein
MNPTDEAGVKQRNNDMPKTIERTEETRPAYYEVYGPEIASRNRAWLLAFLAIGLAVMALGFAIVVRMQPPTVIRIGANGVATVVGQPTHGNAPSVAVPGSDEFLNQAFIKLFLEEYLNYSPSNVDEHWAAALNMMPRNARDGMRKALTDANARGKIDDEQIQSEFHLRELDRVPGAGLHYLAYGVKDVHHLVKGSETTDHFVDEYRIELLTDQRSKTNPNGLWIAKYSERPIDGERRDQILAASDNDNPTSNGGTQ